MRILALTLFLCTLSSAFGHGQSPKPGRIQFSAIYEDSQWVLTDSQGVFVNLKSGFRWLCEDAIMPYAAVKGIAISADVNEVWTVATGKGLFRSLDRGCNFPC